MARKKKKTGTLPPGTFTAAGASVGGLVGGPVGAGVGAAAGAVLDVGQLVIGGISAFEEAKEEQRRFELEFGLSQVQLSLAIEKQRKEEEDQRIFAEALRRAISRRRGA